MNTDYCPNFRIPQVRHGNNIIDVFKEGIVRYALLWAFVQSGKTGTYNFIIRKMLQTDKVQRVYVLCGSHEVGLREQAIRDVKHYNLDLFNKGKITVLFRQDFKSATMDITNSLIVVDESHLDQTQGQELSKFLERHSGLTMSGSSPIMEENNTFIVSVDATPYSEISTLKHGKSFPKHVEIFHPESSYFGIAQYYYNGLVKSTFDFTTLTGISQMRDLMSGFNKKYFIIRINGSKTYLNKIGVIYRIAREIGARVHCYFEDKTDITFSREEQCMDLTHTIPCVEDEPDCNTIILIKGRLRAGKVVPKTHIGFVWEDSKNSKTDVIIQGLFGRMCGYVFGEKKPLIFLPSSSLKTLPDSIVTMSEIERYIMAPEILPTQATNIRKIKSLKAPTDSEGRRLTQTPPFLIHPEMHEDDIEYFVEEGQYRESVTKGICLSTLQRHLTEILSQHPSLSSDQIHEIHAKMDSISTDNITVRHLSGTKHHAGTSNSWFKKLREGHQTHTSTAENISNPTFLTFGIVYHGYLEAHAQKGMVFVIFHTENKGWVTSASKDALVPKDNGKSIFSIHDPIIRESSVAVAAVGFTDELITSPEKFKRIISTYVHKTLHPEEGLMYDKFIQNKGGKMRFRKDTFHFEDKRSNDVMRILDEIGSELHVKFRVTNERSAEDSLSMFGISKISWK